MKLESRDKQGKSIEVGTTAEIPVMPEWLIQNLPEDEVISLRRLEGQRFRVLEIDEYGYLWFGVDDPWFCVRPEDVSVVE